MALALGEAPLDAVDHEGGVVGPREPRALAAEKTRRLGRALDVARDDGVEAGATLAHETRQREGGERAGRLSVAENGVEAGGLRDLDRRNRPVRGVRLDHPVAAAAQAPGDLVTNKAIEVDNQHRLRRLRGDRVHQGAGTASSISASTIAGR